MKKRLILIIFIAVCIFQIFIISSMIFKVYYVKNDSKEIIIDCKLYDPVNPLKGRYLYLTFPDLSSINIKNTSFSNLSKDKLKELIDKEVFINLNKYKYDRYYKISDVSLVKPEKGIIFLKQKINNIWFDRKNNDDVTSDYLSFEYPFNKYYIQEDIAVKTENYLRNTANDSVTTTFDLSLKVNENGEYSVGNLKINNKKIEDFFVKN
jgi:uncharacterized membrane-anchored protein